MSCATVKSSDSDAEGDRKIKDTIEDIRKKEAQARKEREERREQEEAKEEVPFRDANGFGQFQELLGLFCSMIWAWILKR